VGRLRARSQIGNLTSRFRGGRGKGWVGLPPRVKSRRHRFALHYVVDEKQNGFRQADFLFSELNGITFACRCGAIHLVAFFLNLIGT